MKRKNNKLAQIKKWISSILVPAHSSKNSDGEKIKRLFITYFDGIYGWDAETNTANTFAMGVCKLEYENNKLTVHLRRPGLLIGKGGRTIDALAKYLGCKVDIIEVNLLK